MRAGATDFVVKPVGAERLEVSLRNALSTKALESEVQRLKRSRAGTLTFKDIITRSARMFATAMSCGAHRCATYWRDGWCQSVARARF